MAGKGDCYRKVDKNKFNSNWDNIFGSKNAASKEERLREPIRYQYTESYGITDGGRSYFEERGVWDAEYIVQYVPPSENN